jgi:SAM-dependent methyltransferase
MKSVKRIAGAILREALELSARIPFGDHECVICGRGLARFLPYRGGSRNIPSLMRVLDVIGSDVDHFSCPWCYSHDRERHLFLFMQVAGIFSFIAGKRVLHFAPERHLSRFVAEAKPEELVRCDLHPWTDDIVQADLLALPFPDGHFDLLIANHVLEHVDDDGCAVAEIVRVLKPGGYAILQTPYSGVMEKTWEDKGIRSAQARLQAFGQEDHVRLYGKDIFERIAQLGLESRVGSHEELLGIHSSHRLGLNPREPFFLFVKPGAFSNSVCEEAR